MLLDIDLDELKFLIEPSYEFLKDKIPYIMEAYIKVYGEEYREHIKENFDSVSYIFLNTIDDVDNFIKAFLKAVINESYKPIFSAFKLEFPDFINYENSNFIVDIFKQHKKIYLSQDDNLELFRTEIRDYLVKLSENIQDCEEQKYLDIQIKYIDDTLIKFDRIMEVLNPKIEQIKNIRSIIERKKVELQKEFIINHLYWLSNSELEFIKNNEDYNVEEFVKSSKTLKMYLEPKTWGKNFFDFGDIAFFLSEYDETKCILDEREKILTENKINYKNANINLSDSNGLLELLEVYYINEIGNRYEGKRALDALNEEFKKYNNRFKEFIDYYKYLMPRDEFIEQHIESFIEKKFLKQYFNRDDIFSFAKILFKHYEESSVKCPNFLYLSYINHYDSDNNCKIDVPFNNVILSQYAGILFNNEGKIESPFSCIFGHEVGHVASLDNFNTGIKLNSCLEFFNELINEYMNQKKNQYMDKNGVLFKSSCIVNNIKMITYYLYFFLLEPLVNRCEDLIKDAYINNNIDIIIDFMGEDLFNEYINIINSFNKYQMENYQDCSQIFDKEPEYVESVKQRINGIMNMVDERNLDNSNKKK